MQKKPKFNIYTVQVLFVNPDKSVKRHRNWGYYRTYEEAEEVIVNNYTDIYENCYYNYGLVNEVPEGILARSTEHWYKADYDNMKDEHNPTVTKCEKPIPKNFGIGLDW